MIRPVVSTTTHGCSRTPRRSRRGGGQPTPRPAGRSALRSPSPGLALRSGRCTRPRRVQLVTSAGCNGKNVNSDLFHTTHKSEPDPGPACALGLAAWKPDPTAEQTARSLGPSPGGASHGGIRRPPEPGGRHWAAGAALTSLLPAASSSNVTGKAHVDDLTERERTPEAPRSVRVSGAPHRVSTADRAEPAQGGRRHTLCSAERLRGTRPPGPAAEGTSSALRPQQLCTSAGKAAGTPQRLGQRLSLFTTRKGRAVWKCLLPSSSLQPGTPGAGHQGGGTAR